MLLLNFFRLVLFIVPKFYLKFDPLVKIKSLINIIIHTLLLKKSTEFYMKIYMICKYSIHLILPKIPTNMFSI